ncbi:MAG TPA: hypothetical protein VIT63_07340, partial [Nitrospira sp.]
VIRAIVISSQHSKFTAALISAQADAQSRLRPKLNAASRSRYVRNRADDSLRYRTMDKTLPAWRSLRGRRIG